MTGKREQKAARIKYKALKYVLNETNKRNFDEIQVIEICKAAGISKVTFFKYFTSKVDLLLYYKSVFTLQLIIQLKKEGKEGIDALKELTRLFAREYEQRPSMLLGLVRYFTSSTVYVSPIPVKPAERSLFFSEVETTYEAISLEALVEQQMLEVVFARQTTLSTDARQLAELFLSTLYGAILVCRMQNKEHVRMFFVTMLGMVFPGIKG